VPNLGPTMSTDPSDPDVALTVDDACQRASAAAPVLAGIRDLRIRLLRTAADALDDAVERLVRIAEEETALGIGRLTGEVGRTSFQLRMFADMVERGDHLELTIDHAGPTDMGPRPDLRRWLVPVGPVAVFAASNFPFAFSVAGGDTASALASGCPVVVKAHPGHPRTSRAVTELVQGAVAAVGGPAGTLTLVEGFEAGPKLVQHPAIRAVGFTGSEAGGRALAELAAARPDQIPFYGELGSINPLVVTPAAARTRGRDITDGLVGSVTLGVGQFCTKPGLTLLPNDTDGRRIAHDVAQRLAQQPPARMLTTSIAEGYTQRAQIRGAIFAKSATTTDAPSVPACAPSAEPPDGEPIPATAVTGASVTVNAADLSPELTSECFGPFTVLALYNSVEELTELLHTLPGSLTGTVHSVDEDPDAARIVDTLTERVGRIVHNGYPTGVAVTWAMQHGGPWPSSTNPGHTSVGQTGIRRWQRPVTFQDSPPRLLPAELRDDYPGAWRRIDGELVPPGTPTDEPRASSRGCLG
jgi:NADP-dependent aldehyde dehydrogenase